MIEIINENGETVQIETEEKKKGGIMPWILGCSVVASAVVGGLLWMKNKKEEKDMPGPYDDSEDWSEYADEDDDLFENEEANNE